MFALKMKVLFVLMIIVAIAVAGDLNGSRDDDGETDIARKKKSKFPFHFLGYGVGIHALAILYWLKVKAIIISFFVGTAVVWGFRYFAHHFKSCPEVIHESPIIPIDHGYHGFHDHISYSAPHDFLDHDPYGGYSHFSESSPDVIESDSPPHRRRISSKGRKMSTEEQVSDIIFAFLGVGSDSCRKRFLCEMEFRSNDNPLTQMAFRVIGRGIFTKYVRNEDEEPMPRSFAECGQVHSDCKFIEENINIDETNEIDESEKNTTASTEIISPDPDPSEPAVEAQRQIDTVAERILRRSSQ